MKVGDLVRNKNSESGMLGLFLEWKTFDENTNPCTYPVIMWADDNRISTIQTSLLEVLSESR
jgi:hypothetical protein